MLTINIHKIVEKCKVENRLQLANLFGWTSKTVYKYSHPERVSGLKLEILSKIAEAIAKEKGVSPLDVKLGDIFDWKK